MYPTTNACFDVCNTCSTGTFLQFFFVFLAGSFIGITTKKVSKLFYRLMPSLKEDHADKKKKIVTKIIDNDSEESSEDKEESTDDEFTKMFNEEENRAGRTEDEILEVGRKTGKEPIVYFSRNNGGYMTGTEMQALKGKYTEYKKLSRTDELDILRTFKNIKNMNYRSACKYVENKGYQLHPLYINNGELNKSVVYDARIIGVKIKDTKYDILHDRLSSSAIVEDLIDIGGQDERSIGKIRL